MPKTSCDLRLGDSRLQLLICKSFSFPGCDLRLGDSRLQLDTYKGNSMTGCDLRLGDSRLQSVIMVAVSQSEL